MVNWSLSRRSLLAGSATLAVGIGRHGAAVEPGDRIRKLVLLSVAQASDPQEFQSAQLVAQMWRALGLDVEVRPMPRPELASIVWNQRTRWDLSMWRMVGRPERSDPDELVFSLFNSATANGGYDFVHYINPEYDRVSQGQRQELDPEKRQQLVYQAQEIVDRDQPYIFLVHPRKAYAFLNTVWDPKSVVDEDGIGIRCFWTYLNATPVGTQKDMILNSSVGLVALNPLYIGGEIDSWMTELIWDRLIRVDPHGMPQPWSAEKTTWVDPTTLDVTIRSGQQWHDGKPLTTEDVAFSFWAPAQGNMSPMYKPFVRNIADVKAVDDKTVRFTLKTPDAGFLTASLGKLNLIPKHVWGPQIEELQKKNLTAEQFQPKELIGSGPFRMVRFNLQEEVVLEANKSHWAAPKMDRWILRVLPNTAAALEMLPRGDINFLSDYTGDPKLLEALARKDPHITMVASTEMGFRFVAPNEQRPPFNDTRFRQALSLAVSRPLIVAAAYEGFAIPANSMVAPVLKFWAKPGINDLKQNVAEAKKALADAGYTVVDGHLHYPPGVKEDTPAF